MFPSSYSSTNYAKTLMFSLLDWFDLKIAAVALIVSTIGAIHLSVGVFFRTTFV